MAHQKAIALLNAAVKNLNMTMIRSDAHAHHAVEQAFQQERSQVLAMLIGWLGDFQLAEDALQDALVAALEHWPTDGLPQRPGAWMAQVARRKALDRIRKQSGRGRAKLEPLDERLAAAAPDWDSFDDIPDDRLKLIFTCCHPALAEDAQIALTLHTLGGLTTAEIARAFLVPVPTMAQRLVRAKRKIKAAGIPFDVPAVAQIADRLDVVFHILYLIFTEGYSAASGEALLRIDLCEEAIRLCRVLLNLVAQAGMTIPPLQAAEAQGLLALLLLHHARRHARIGAHGELILLDVQERSRWEQAQIAEGIGLLEATMVRHYPGPYQLQAAIAALHVEAAIAEATDWPQIAVFANLGCAGELDTYHPYHVACAQMLRRSGQFAAAQRSYLTALDLCQNTVERAAILRALASVVEAGA